MKQAVNFRLSAQARAVLTMLSESLHIAKTDVVERALRHYAQEKMRSKQTALLKHAGALKEKDADEMLEDIYSSRHNKENDTKL